MNNGGHVNRGLRAGRVRRDRGWIIWRHYDVLRPSTRPGCAGCGRRSLGLIVEAFRMRCIDGIHVGDRGKIVGSFPLGSSD